MFNEALFGEVIGKEVFEIEFENNSLITYRDKSNKAKYGINSHEMANRYKDWASKEGYAIFSGKVGKEFRWLARIYLSRKTNEPSIRIFTGLTEPISIIECCEWIAELKEDGIDHMEYAKRYGRLGRKNKKENLETL